MCGLTLVIMMKHIWFLCHAVCVYTFLPVSLTTPRVVCALCDVDLCVELYTAPVPDTNLRYEKVYITVL